MNLEELDIYLRHINVFEQKQRETGKSLNDISRADKNFDTYVDPKFNIFRFPKSLAKVHIFILIDTLVSLR